MVDKQHAETCNKRAVVSNLISNKKISKTKTGVDRCSLHQEDIAMIHIYLFNTKVLKYTKKN